jgi:hypothetical protein
MKGITFDELLSRVQDHLKKPDTKMRAAIKPKEMLETIEQKQFNAEARQKKT